MDTQTFGDVVPRGLYEALLVQHKDLADKYAQLVDQTFALMDKVMEMKRGGLNYAEHVEFEQPKDPHEIPSAVQDAILERVASGSIDAQRMKEAAFGMLRTTDEKAVIKAILAGEDLW